MAKRPTKIEWTAYQAPDGRQIPGYTFTPWRGCTKVGPECQFCYAEVLSNRNPKVLGEWGPRGERSPAAKNYWAYPLAWNAEAEQMGARIRVFCSSLSDVFEGPETMPAESVPVVEQARERLWSLIEQTPHLDWLLLTKRPANIARFLPERWGVDRAARTFPEPERFPANVWMGASMGLQRTLEEFLPELLRVPARVLFVSAEPLLGPLQFIIPHTLNGVVGTYNTLTGDWWTDDLTRRVTKLPKVGWVIVGGESGRDPRIRPMHPAWVRDICRQCQNTATPFTFKQWGEWVPVDAQSTGVPVPLDEMKPGRLAAMTVDGHRAAAGEFLTPAHTTFWRAGKEHAGRMLDGKIWEQSPV